MVYSVSRAVVDAFYEAYRSRDPAQIGAALDDEVEWHIAGPVDVMKVCGYWCGKQAVVDRFSGIAPEVIDFISLDIENLLVDGAQSALFGKITCVHRESGRLICHRIAHIVRYREDKVLYFRCISDSLDAVEQYLGHQIELTDESCAVCSDFITV